MQETLEAGYPACHQDSGSSLISLFQTYLFLSISHDHRLSSPSPLPYPVSHWHRPRLRGPGRSHRAISCLSANSGALRTFHGRR